MSLKTYYKEMPAISNDRILSLEVEEGKKALNVTGSVDPTLLKGNNHLHVVMDGTLWMLRQESGEIPHALRQRWTTFNRAFKAAKEYYQKRNIIIKEVE